MPATMIVEVPNERTTATTATLPRVNEAGRISPWRGLRRRIRRPDRQKRRSLDNPSLFLPNRWWLF
jgi:hypothetical protein